MFVHVQFKKDYNGILLYFGKINMFILKTNTLVSPHKSKEWKWAMQKCVIHTTGLNKVNTIAKPTF
jgi:hypothetical protein